MEVTLNPVESRILGALIEKQMATPDYYPLTLNALVNACNQKNNRNPVLSLDSSEVELALNSLREQRLVWQVRTHGSRAPKYEQNLNDFADFSRRQLALICELLLRGPQTPGELRTRASRLIEFQGVRAVEYTLTKLMEHEKGPFVTQLPRRPGHKENRYAHLFAEVDEETESAAEASVAAPDVQAVSDGDNARIEALEQQVSELSEQLRQLAEEFRAFKAEFE
ncbi:MAG: YceH family protein [Desulfobacterales bacterium]|nr:YceH family protein [Desulfobacterales bacterium]